MEMPYIPTDPHKAQMKIKQAIQRFKESFKFTLECLISIYIALEISIPPNPYKTHLIILLTIYICLKYNIPSKVIQSIERLIDRIKSTLA